MRLIALLRSLICLASASADHQEPPRTLLLPFVNHAGQDGDDLCRPAEETVHTQLAAWSHYSLVPAKETRRALDGRPSKPPFDTNRMFNVAHELAAENVVTGEIAFMREAHGRTAVGLRVFVYDARSRDLINGAAQIGYSNLGDAAAARDAAMQAMKRIVAYVPITGIVLNTMSGPPLEGPLVNRGTRHGVCVGALLRVCRDGDPVAVVKVTDVFPTDAETRVIDLGKGIRPSDEVRLIFQMPPFPKLEPAFENTSPATRISRPIDIWD